MNLCNNYLAAQFNKFAAFANVTERFSAKQIRDLCGNLKIVFSDLDQILHLIIYRIKCQNDTSKNSQVTVLKSLCVVQMGIA